MRAPSPSTPPVPRVAASARLARPWAVIALVAWSAAARPAAAQASSEPAWAARLDALVRAELARTRTPGAQVAVVVNGAIAFQRAYGVADMETRRPVTDPTLFRVGPVTTMFTAATINELVAEGRLDLKAPIATYVPELAGRRVGTVTTEQLLSHHAGWLDNAVAYGRMGEGALGEVMREVTDTLFFTEPARVISYSNPGFSMAGYVAERAGGARFAALTEQKVLRRVGMARATFRPLEVMTQDFSQGHMGATGADAVVVRPFTENTAQWAAGFLFASAGEVARFTIALMNGGVVDGARVLDAGTVARMTTGLVAVPGRPTARYAHGLMIETRGTTRVWSHGGAINGFDAQVTMYPDHRAAVVVVDNRSGAPLAGIADLVAREAVGLPINAADAPPADRDGTAAERALVVGRYAMGTTRVEIAEEDGRLVFVQRDRLPAKLVGDDRLAIIAPDGERTVLVLVRGAGGRVEYLHQSLRALARQP